MSIKISRVFRITTIIVLTLGWEGFAFRRIYSISKGEDTDMEAPSWGLSCVLCLKGVFFLCCRVHSAQTIPERKQTMENRIAIVGIIVEDMGQTAALNNILHDYGGYIIGRMGIPYRSRGVSLISVMMDAPSDVISALSGKVGRLSGIRVSTTFGKIGKPRETGT